MDDRGAGRVRDGAGELVAQVLDAGQVAAAGGVELGAPPLDLAGEEPFRAAEVLQADGGGVDRVQVGEHVDEPFGQCGGHGGGDPRALGAFAQGGAGHLLHEVERRADHGGVLDEQFRAGHRHGCGGERGDDAELAGHVVRGGEDVAQRRAAQHPGPGAVADAVGQVRAAAAEQLAGQRACAQVRGQCPQVEAGKVGHRVTPRVARSQRVPSAVVWRKAYMPTARAASTLTGASSKNTARPAGTPIRSRVWR